MEYKFKLKPGQQNPTGYDIKHLDGWSIVEVDDIKILPAGIEFFSMTADEIQDLADDEAHETGKEERLVQLWRDGNAAVDVDQVKDVLLRVMDETFIAIRGKKESKKIKDLAKNGE